MFNAHPASESGAMLRAAVQVLLLIGVLTAGTQARAASTEYSVNAAMNEYRIHPGDVLNITVWKDDDLSRTVTVRPDGYISLPLVDEIDVDGMTPAELQQKLTDELRAFIDVTSRKVSVIVEQVNSFRVSVIGEVNAPGRYSILGRTSVLDMLAEAGGLTEFASRSDIAVLRRTTDGMIRIPFNYRSAISGRGDQEVFFVMPGDVILIP